LLSDRHGAVTQARHLFRECPENFTDLFRVGRAINRAAAFEETHRDLALREAATLLLDRTVQLRGHNAAAWFEYGLAIKKRGGLQIDVYRAINRALDLADRYPDSTPPTLLAEIQFERARHLQDWVDRFRWLRDFRNVPVATPACSNLGLFCENYIRPAAFNALVRDARPIPVDVGGDREQLMSRYREVLRLDSGLVEAAERLGRELALGEEWEELEQLAEEEVRRSPSAPFFDAVRALAVERMGHARQADSVFDVTVPSLPDSMRQWYAHPPKGLDTVADFWRRSRPLWLGPYNDFQLEYWTRLTYAFLVFGDREASVAGPETPEGDALIRYGWPERITQMNRNQSTLLGSNQMAAIIAAALDCTVEGGGALPKCADPVAAATSDAGGGSWLIWTYAMDRPSMIFEQRPGRRVPHYVFDGAAQDYAAQLRKASPLTYTSKLAAKSSHMPVQVARFQGEGDATLVVLFGLVPAQQMGLAPRDSIATGLFVFRDTAGFPSVAEQAQQCLPGAALGLSYRVPLRPGRYAYSVEAYSAAYGIAATARDSLVAPVWHYDSLEMSDLLVAQRVTPSSNGQPVTWRDLFIEPSRTLTITAGGSATLVWETYGLRAGALGVGEYHVRLTVEDANARPQLVRLLSRLGLGGKQGGTAVIVEWDAQRPLAPDGRALEYVSVQLPDDAAGTYAITVTITDRTGRSTRATHRITIVPAPH
jgi:GWxTD domain-containing protein